MMPECRITAATSRDLHSTPSIFNGDAHGDDDDNDDDADDDGGGVYDVCPFIFCLPNIQFPVYAKQERQQMNTRNLFFSSTKSYF